LLYQGRFPKNEKDRNELLYKVGDCLERAGEEETARAAFEKLAKLDSDNPWGKLAKFQLGGAMAFVSGMEELVELSGAGGENGGLSLALAEANFPTLPEAARLKCLYLKARCHAGREGEGAKAAALWRAICKDHPASRWAADSAFWLAEHELEQRHF